MRSNITQSTTVTAVAVFLSGILFSFNYVYSQKPIYKGKNIDVIIGTTPGGSQDLRTRLVVKYLSKHIPGNPTFVNLYMPGGGGMKSANHTYLQARPDGLSIASPGSTIIDNAILGHPGVEYDVDKFIFLGAPVSVDHSIFMTSSKLGLTNLKKLREKPGLRIPGLAVGHVVYIWARLYAWLLDLKDPKFVLGYSTPERELTLRQGEADVFVTSIFSILRENPEYIDEKLFDFHVTFNIPKGARHPHPHFKSLPDLDSFAKTEMEHKVLKLARSARVGATPFALPPGTPENQAAIFEKAIRATFKDPEYLGEFKKITGQDATPVFREDYERALKEMPREPEVINLYKAIAGGKSLPPR